jgi:hypothetical protein
MSKLRKLIKVKKWLKANHLPYKDVPENGEIIKLVR